MDMTETNLPKTTEMLHTLSVEQLKELKGQITQMIALKGGNRFSIGAKCGVNHRRLFGRIGIIKKINSIKCKVDFDGEIFNVPKTLIELI
jgi:hypothetical protein